MALAREEYLLDKWGRLRAMLGWKREPGQNWYARRMLTNKWKVLELEYVEGSMSWLNMLRGYRSAGDCGVRIREQLPVLDRRKV